jgi:UDP-glucuronate decarboxylase
MELVPRLYDSRKRILVTGGAGSLGPHPAERLLEGGHEKVCVEFTRSTRNIEHLQSQSRFDKSATLTRPTIWAI